MPKIFVYGTLRKGESNHYFLRNATLIRENFLLQGYELRANLHYPYAFLSEDKEIIGDVYEISEASMIGDLDDLEGVSENYYMRFWDEKNDFFIYLKAKDNRDDYPVIENGDWIDYRKNKKNIQVS